MAARKKKEPPVMTLDQKRARVSELAVVAGGFIQDGQHLVNCGDGNGAAMALRQAADALEAWQLVRDSYQAQLVAEPVE